MQWSEKGSEEAKQCLDEGNRLQYLGRELSSWRILLVKFRFKKNRNG